MTRIPRVTVVTVYYNRADDVTASIQSLLDQTLEDIAIFAVDDGSTDGTLAALKTFSDPRLRIISKENSGFTNSIIQAVEQAESEYVAIHGSGDISLPRRLERQADALDRNPDVGVVGCWIENLHPDGQITAHPPANDDEPFSDLILDRGIFTHGEVMYRKSLYHRVGGYRTFFKFAQDYDLWLRISEMADFMIIKEVLYRRTFPANTVRRDPRKLLMQSQMSELARQATIKRRSGGEDIIERFGAQALTQLQKSAKLGDMLVGMGANIMIHERNPDGRLLIEKGIVHSPTLANQMRRWIAYNSARPGFSAMRAILTKRRRLRSHADRR